jgi:lysyl-tRNA synthetase class 1
MAAEVFVKEPTVMRHFFFDLLKTINVENFFPNIQISRKTREAFVDERAAVTINIKTGNKEPITDVVIFTGSKENADKLRNIFQTKTLFIANGSGHNPFIVTETANIEKAVHDVVDVQLYNQGQDCSAPNAILVHADVYNAFVSQLRAKIKTVKIGPYVDRNNRVGPISRKSDLERIESVLVNNANWIDPATEGVIRTKSGIVEPTLILKPLKNGGNYEETFAPIFFVQKYDTDWHLAKYFEQPAYEQNAMYIALYGKSAYIESMTGKPFACGRVLHPAKTIIRNSNSHVSGFERGTQEYGGYGHATSSISIYGKFIPKPTLPQRDIFEYLVRPSKQVEIVAKKMQKVGTKKAQKLSKKESPSRKERFTLLNNNTTRLPMVLLSGSEKHWSSVVAEKAVEVFPNRRSFVCVSALAPLCPIDATNLRHLMTAFAVQQSLLKQDVESEVLLYWKDLDVLRDVPSRLDTAFEKYIGLPLASIPDPIGEYASYAKHIETEFESALLEMNIDARSMFQSEMYVEGQFDLMILRALQKREEIAEIIYQFMPDQRRNMALEAFSKQYYPVHVFSRFNGKAETEILDYDGETHITYRCKDTGGIETIDITKSRCAKLKKVTERAAYWQLHDIAFEAGGPEQNISNANDAYDASVVVGNKVFGIQAPIFISPEVVGLQGADRLSARHGTASITNFLQVYDPLLLKWLYLKTEPSKRFFLTFNGGISAQYEEFDHQFQAMARNELQEAAAKTSMEMTYADKFPLSQPAPFGQIIALGQIVRWDFQKLLHAIKELSIEWDSSSLARRFRRAKMWLEAYNNDQRISLLKMKNEKYATQMSTQAMEHVSSLKRLLINSSISLKNLEENIYNIPKLPELPPIENKTRQKAFFRDVYHLLFDRETGPRLSTFLWAADKNEIERLLTF